MKFVKSSVVFATAALVDSANAWWGTGHLLVARIANDLLETQAPDVLKNAEAVLAAL
jgi:hypothetical protein